MGSTKGKRDSAQADTVKALDLSAERPTGNEYFHGSDSFDDLLGTTQPDEIDLEGKIEKVAEGRARIFAGPLSPVPLALTGFLGNVVLHLTGQPEWAQLGVVTLPWAIAGSWVASRALSRRSRPRGARQGTVPAPGRVTPVPARAEP